MDEEGAGLGCKRSVLSASLWCIETAFRRLLRGSAMKMFGKVTVSIEGVSNIDISEVRARLVRALRVEEAGKIVESGDVIHYRRGYPIRAYVQNRLASFDRARSLS